MVTLATVPLRAARMCPRPRPTMPGVPGTIPRAPCCCGRPGRHPAPEPHGPLTLAILVQAVVGSAVPAGQAEPREERLEHGQVTAVEGQVAGEGAQADCQGAAVGGRGPTPGRGTRDAREAARGREGQDGTSGQSLCVQGRQARPEPPRRPAAPPMSIPAARSLRPRCPAGGRALTAARRSASAGRRRPPAHCRRCTCGRTARTC